MFPEPLFHLGPWPVAAYTLCHLLAVVVFAALVLGRRERSAPASWTAAVLCRFLAAMLAGAWLGSWLAVALLRGTPLAGGHSSLGALAGALLAAVWLARRERAGALRRLDWLVPALAAADATARLGCFAAGCCHGRPVWGLPWAVSFPVESGCLFPGVPVHPVQLYLSLGGFALAGVLSWLNRRRRRSGLALGVFLTGIGGLRLALDPFRSHAPTDGPWPALHTLLAGTLLLAGVVVLIWRLSHGRDERDAEEACPNDHEVLDCGRPLPLLNPEVADGSESGRGLPHSKTLARVRSPGFSRNPMPKPAEAGTTNLNPA